MYKIQRIVIVYGAISFYIWSNVHQKWHFHKWLLVVMKGNIMRCYTEMLQWNQHCFLLFYAYISILTTGVPEVSKNAWKFVGICEVMTSFWWHCFQLVPRSSKAQHQFWVGTSIEMVIMHLNNFAFFIQWVNWNIILYYFPVNSWIACLFYLPFVFPLRMIGIFLKGKIPWYK